MSGGWLDYDTLSDNDAVRALAVRFVAIVVVLVAGVAWARRHGHRSSMVAFAGAAFFVGSLIGGWIAPSIHPVGWSEGSARVELRGAVSRTDTIALDCSSALEGAMLSLSSGTQGRFAEVAPGSVWLSVTIQAEAPLSGGPVRAGPSTGFYLDVGTGVPGSGQEFNYNPEAGTTTISAQGTSQRGQLTFENLPALVGGQVGVPNDLPTLSGVIDWTCQPANDAPTPVEGSWFS